MACASPSITPALPGAWASNWTLSRTYFPTSDKTPKAPRPDLDAIRDGKNEPALTKKNSSRGGMSTLVMNVEGRSTASADDTDRESEAGEDLADAEDFYSFISHGSSQEDTDDTTLYPSSLSITRIDASGGTGLREPRGAASHANSALGPSRSTLDIKDAAHLSSRTTLTQRASACTLTPASDSNSPARFADDGQDKALLALDIVSGGRLCASSRLDLSVMDVVTSAGRHQKRACQLDASMDKHASATSDDGVGARDGATRRVEEDSECCCTSPSMYSEESAEQVQHFIDRLDAQRSFCESSESLSQASWDGEQPSYSAANERTPLHSILNLTQPNGDNPWTLSLDPTQPLNNLNPLSRQSSRATESTTLSDESSIAFTSQMHGMISEDHIPSPSYRQSPAARVRARYYNNEDYEIRTTPRQDSEYSSSSFSSPGQAQSFPTMGTMSSSPTMPSFIIYAHNDPPRAKPTGVIQKTKALCSKFKKFVTKTATRTKLGTSQVPAVEYDPFLRRNAIDLADYDMSPPLPYLSGRQSVSLNGHQGFQRATKVSTISVPLVQPKGHRRTGAVDVQRDYEPPPMPVEVTKEVKASRRFSLPVFAGNMSTPLRSRRFSTFASRRLSTRQID